MTRSRPARRRRMLARLGAAIAATLLVAVGDASWARADAVLRRFIVNIANRKVPQDLRVIRVTKGDRVEIEWSSDRPHVLHLHGYDIETSLVPGQPAVMGFPAHATGRFAIELHDGTREHHVLLHIEVHPR